jgi:hypothetical protein
MKQTLCVQDTLPVSITIVEILTQKDTSAPQRLHYAHISSIAWNICQVISVVKVVNHCKITMGRTVQQAVEGRRRKKICNHYYLPSNWTAGHSTDSV